MNGTEYVPQAVTMYREAKAEAWRKGKAAGVVEGELKMLFRLVDDGLLSFDAAVSKSNMTEAEFKLRMAQQKA